MVSVSRTGSSSALGMCVPGAMAACLSALWAAPAMAQTCSARSSYRFAQSMCNQAGIGEPRPGSNVWSTTVPLVVSATNTNSNPQGCTSTCTATARAAFRDLSFVASGSGNNCTPCGIFLWIDEWIGGAPKAETNERFALTSATLPNGSPVQIRITMTFLGGGGVNAATFAYSQSASVLAGNGSGALSAPGTMQFVANGTVGQNIDVWSRLYCTMQAYSLQGGSPASATMLANLRLLTNVEVLTPGVVATSCSAGTPACRADLDDGSGAGAPDGGVDINDLLYFLTAFEAGSVAVDIDNGSGNGTPDGGVDINDLLYFFVRFEAGC